jgi:hypothetical protein
MGVKRNMNTKIIGILMCIQLIDTAVPTVVEGNWTEIQKHLTLNGAAPALSAGTSDEGV